MNVLFLTQVLPYPLDAGPKVRAYYVLRHLAAQHQVTLVSFVRSTDGPKALAHLRELCAQVITCLLPRSRLHDLAAAVRSSGRGEPVLIARDWQPTLVATLTTLMETTCFDVVHADQLWMAPYALVARKLAARRGHRPRLVLDQHNAVHLIPRRMAAAARSPISRLMWQREARLMARYEARACLSFDEVITVTDPDQQALRALYPKPPQPAFGEVIPICIDAGAVPAPAPLADQPGILFLGGMHWPPNSEGVLWFCREALPAVHAEIPEAVLWAIGRQPPAELALLDSALNGRRGVIQASGYVVDPEPFWAKSRVFVVPLLAGGGMRVKILDAWARGVPVVSTNIGAEGLDARDGDNILLADTPAEFAQAVIRVLGDAALAARLSESGRRTVATQYDWRLIYPAWDRVYAGTIETA